MKIVNYYFALLIILLSGSVFFFTKYAKLFIMILFFSSIVLLVFNKIKININNISKLLIFFLLTATNVAVTLNNGIDYNSLVGIILITVSLVIIQSNIKEIDFKESFLNIMAILSIISLICFYLSDIIPMESFPFYRQEFIRTSIYNYSFYYTWGWGTKFNRNSSLFWEPGAFQTYLNLALTFLIFDDNNINQKKYIILLILYIVTILSTKSTTGYIVLSIIIVYSLLSHKIKVDFSRRKALSIIIFVIVSIFALNTIIKSNVIEEKFSQTEYNSSYQIRKKDTKGSAEIIMHYPLTGVGIYSELKSFEESLRDIHNNSNGILAFTMMFGIPITIVYLICLYFGIKDFYKTEKKFDSIIIFIIFIILYSSEFVLLTPIFLSFLFRWNKSIKNL